MIKQVGRWLPGLAPDIAATVRRFPYASVLLALATLVALLLVNEVVDEGDPGLWPRLLAGLMTGALLAAAGVLFSEAKGLSGSRAALVIYVPPLVMIGLFQVEDARFAVPWMLPAVAVLLTSISPSFVEDADRETRQHRFWRANAHAIPTALFAIFVGVLIALALFATAWSLSRLFSLEIVWVFERYVYPVLALLLIPLFWFSTLPKGDEAAPEARAVGLLGQFVLIPFALVYALILHVYAIQILIIGALPDGVVGPMVLYFVLAGHFTWLLVYPEFLRAAGLVRFFRRVWFALCVVPLALFAVALWVRIDAYGLTPLRVLLMLFGIWAVAVTLIFLVTRGRADIRLVPGLAALILLLGSLGPTNPENLPRWQQTVRLQALVAEARTDGEFVWTPEAARAATAAFDYLAFETGDRSYLGRVLRSTLGAEAVTDDAELEELRAAAGLDDLPPGADPGGRTPPGRARHLSADSAPVDLGEYRYFHGVVSISRGQARVRAGVYALWVEGSMLHAEQDGEVVGSADVRAWALAQEGDRISAPLIVLSGRGPEIALLVQEFGYSGSPEDEGDGFEIELLHGLVFGSDSGS